MTARLAVTGAAGFLGWHVRCRAMAMGGFDVVPISRADCTDAEVLAERLEGVDAVLHLAGVNRGDPREVEHGNIALARVLERALNRCGGRPRVIYADSVRSRDDTPYGHSKKRAGEILGSWAARAGGTYRDVVLPNLFGEHGRPFHNSFIATFCHQLVTGGRPVVTEDRPIELLYAQDAAAELLRAATAPATTAAPATTEATEATRLTPRGRTHSVGDIRDRLAEFAGGYRDAGLPPLSTSFDVQLFNTYRSFLFPDGYPIPLVKRVDERGRLVEAVKQRCGSGQVFYSVSRPGVVRGDHFHLRKIERFLVVSGSAVIKLRRLGTDEVIRFEVTGDTPEIVDMPVLWTHSITNIGSTDLVTMFWCNELFDQADPDTYPEPVEEEAGVRCAS